MGDLSKNFSKSEFECKCGCGMGNIDPELINVLQDLRDWWRAPITINSGCRCYEYNEKVQLRSNPDYIPGSSRSQHMLGTAADIVVSGISVGEVRRYLNHKYPDKYGIGAYNSFTHIDVRSKKARW